MSGQFDATQAYNQPSAGGQSTRQIIDQPISSLQITPLAPTDSSEVPIKSKDISSSDTSKDPNSASFRPEVFRRRSSNYEIASKKARDSVIRKSLDELASDLDPSNAFEPTAAVKESQEDMTNQKGPENGMNWQPKFARKQSWDVQDWKHNLQMSGIEKDKPEDNGGPMGFTEKGRNDA